MLDSTGILWIGTFNGIARLHPFSLTMGRVPNATALTPGLKGDGVISIADAPNGGRWLGTMAGGWRIVKTMGMRITKLRPVGGFCAETAGAITLIGTAVAGIPVSTTQTISGSIMGVGSLQRLSAVRWGVAGRILWAWILTIPASALVAAGTWLLLRLLM